MSAFEVQSLYLRHLNPKNVNADQEKEIKHTVLLGVKLPMMISIDELKQIPAVNQLVRT